MEQGIWVLLFCIYVFNPSSVNGDTNPSDVSALNVLYTSLNSDGQLTGWTSNGGDPCRQSWTGITCSGSSVTSIKLSGLGLSGNLGYQLNSMNSLLELDMSSNNLGSSITYNIPTTLQKLNLAGNSFNGSIPYLISQMTSLQNLNLARNQLDNNLNIDFGHLTNLTTVNLSFNSITGTLPDSMKSLSSLTILHLQNNQFSGPIDVLANLPLQDLNIANNRFTGWIPDQLENINNLQTSGNSWSSGSAPPPPPYTPPPTGPSVNPNIPSNGGGGGKSSGIGSGGIADEMRTIHTSSTVNTIVLQPSATFNLRPPPTDRHKDKFSNKPILAKKFDKDPMRATVYSVADLQEATNSFSIDHIVGEGSIGRVYRAQFTDGKVLAVKKISFSALPTQSTNDFMEIVSNISRLHHPNLTELAGYCSEHGQHLLVYEFQKNGSLHDLLHISDDYSEALTWNSRVKIALGTARALEYLHEVCSPYVVHKNFKSRNILLDTELNPHLSDSGLANLIPNVEYQALDHNMSSGYAAPEVTMSGQYTMKSDVYCFGVVMLELLTGRMPFDGSRLRSEHLLVRWATPQLHDIDALDKMVDPALKGLYPAKSLSRFADVIALCVQSEPEFRPPMSEVVEALVRLVQRANMSKRMVGGDAQETNRGAQDYMF